MEFCDKKIEVEKGDVMFTFEYASCHGVYIDLYYTISYFSIPSDINEYMLDKVICFESLKEAIKDEFGEFAKFGSLLMMNSKGFVVRFDVKDFLEKATFPLKFESEGGYAYISLNKRVPYLVSQSCEYADVFNRVMKSMMNNNKKFNLLFKNKSKKFALYDVNYDMVGNGFEVSMTELY